MNAENRVAYRCAICCKIYDDKDDAFNCHAGSEQIEAWSCSRCGSVHEEKEEAERCCKSHPTE